jgi:cytochrome c
MDTMKSTKITAALCAALLVLLLGKWAAEEIYHVDGHGQQAYVIDTGAEEADDAAEEVSFDVLLAEADVGKGAKVFGKCKSCHKLEDGANGTGPHLYAVVNRAVGGADGFRYSGTLAGLGGEWTTDALNGFLENPKSYAPGTTMGFAGLKKPEDRAAVIAYLQSIGG